MVTINRLARAVLLVAVLWSAGSSLAALNWHGNWRVLARGADEQADVAVHAQERWQHWVDMTLLGVVVAVIALVVALWPLIAAAGRPGGERERGGRAGFGGGSEESRRSAVHHDDL